MEKWKKNLNILWLTQVFSIMGFGFGVPFIPFYIQELGVTSPEQIKLFTGIISTAPAITMAVMAPVWGILSDRFGRKMMIIRAMLASALIIGGMAFATNVWHLVFLRAAQGLFTGTVTAANAFVASDTPQERMSYALGMMSSSTFIGFSLGPVMGGIFAEMLGYRFSFLAGSAIMTLGLLLVVFLVREDKSKIKHNLSKQVKNGYRKIFTPLVLGLLMILLFHRVTRSVFSPYLPLFVQEMLGQTTGAAKITGYANGLVGFATAIAGLTISRLGDRVNKLNFIFVLLSLAFGMAIVVNFTTTLSQFVIAYALMFFFMGGVEPIVVSATAQNTPQEYRGALFGFQGLVGSLGWMVSPMMGAVISLNYGIKAILWVLPVVILINIVTVRIIHFKRL
jgi:DHA1 family multidrug resistance protein-like MFS transporter